MSKPATPEPVRRLRAVDEIDRLHDLAGKLAERRQPTSLVPVFKGGQVKAVGGNVVNEWEVHVPVCEEFGTADEAFSAFERYAARMAELFPPPTPTPNGGEKKS